MRIGEAMGGLTKENIVLKIALLVSVLSSGVLMLGLVVEASKPPILIDRSLIGENQIVRDQEPTDQETKSFVRQSLAQRFNTESSDTNYLTDSVRSLRKSEQQELSKSQMKQFVYVESIELGKAGISAQTTRLIMVGDIRSSFRFPLALKIERVERTPSNPYGMVLTEVLPVKDPDSSSVGAKSSGGKNE